MPPGVYVCEGYIRLAPELTQRLFRLEPQYRERVWGGQRLKAQDPPVGEAWVAFGESVVSEGAHAGQTVAELAERHGAALLGDDAASRFGTRFPLLVKLLDCADWLSVQVHPDDEQARRLVGPDASGKTEAWHLIEAEPGASILAGTKPGTTRAELEAAIRGGNILEVAQRREVHAGETYLLPAGTLHSLGPGLLLYEVQQASDTTYRVYDWGRPARAGRELHVEESVAVTDPEKCALLTTAPVLEGTQSATRCAAPSSSSTCCGSPALQSRPTRRGSPSTSSRLPRAPSMSPAAASACDSADTRRPSSRDSPAREIHAADGMASLLRAAVPGC